MFTSFAPRFLPGPSPRPGRPAVARGVACGLRAKPLVAVCLLAAAWLCGCAGPGPRPFPAAPLTNHTDAERTERHYDTDGDGQPDYRETLTRDGRVFEVALNHDGRWIASPWPCLDSDAPHLFLVLDSIPFDLVEEAWAAGRLRLFAHPSRMISVFPAMTDPALAEMLGVSPCRAVEANYYDGRRLHEGMDAYLATANAPWWPLFDYTLDSIAHGFQYLDPWPWFRHELGRVEERFLREPRDYMAYSVGTSGLGSMYGREAHVEALGLVDQFCRSLVAQTGGRVQITLLSDHGHDHRGSRRVSLRSELAAAGYRVSRRLRGPNDVVIPEFGQVTCAAVHTQEPWRVARDLAGSESVDLAMYVDRAAVAESQCVVVVGAGGVGRLSRGPLGWQYEVEGDDPLRLTVVRDELLRAGAIREGQIDDRALFLATVDHEFPDPFQRIWRGFFGQFEIVPDVLVSLRPGFYTGSADLNRMMKMIGVHGSLARESTTGFVMTTAGELPPSLRAAEVIDALRVHGLRIRTGRPAGETR